MEGQQVEAMNNLVSLSQQTNYLANWNEQIQHQKSKQKKPLYQEHIKREQTQRYDLKKWQRKRQSLNQLQYPIINNDSPQDHTQLVKSKFSTPQIQSKASVKRRDTFNKQINRIIEQRLMKIKLEHFKKSINLLEHNIKQQQQSYKPTHLPRSFTIKKKYRGHLAEIDRAKQEYDRSVHEYKNDLEQQKRKYSMPNLGKINTHRYVSYGQH